MFTISDAQLNALLATFLWPLARVGAFIAAEPMLGARSIPVRVRALLAVVLTVAIAPAVVPPAGIEVLSATGLLVIVQQIFIGAALGLVVRVVFTAVELAGHMGGMQMGLGFATFFDPQHSAQIPVVAQFYSVLVLLMYIAMNGHLLTIATLHESFSVLPVGVAPLSAAGFARMAHWGGVIFSHGLLLSMPVVAALLVANLAIGVMTRASPQLNIFAIGFPITLMIGVFVTYASFPYLVRPLEGLFNSAVLEMLSIVRAMAPRP